MLPIDSCFYLWCAVIKLTGGVFRSIIKSVWDITVNRMHGHARLSDVRLSKIKFYNDNLQDPKRWIIGARARDVAVTKGLDAVFFVYESRHRGVDE